ncbi:MAG: molybdopterin-binding protein [Thermodesulfovibrionales bacterium]|jgi:molybdenum cofactor synthesis domain-containing protein
MAKTAGIIIIGDEILTGKVQDYNSFFMAQELWSHGVQLCRISIIPDIVDEIAEEVRTFSDKFDFVFTSGGIGPTHDDVTIEGISKGFNVAAVIDPTLKEALESRLGKLSPEQMKMAEAPEGSELVNDDTLSFPLIRFRNVFILPGIPQLLRKKFFAIENLFDEPPVRLKKVFLMESESKVAPILNDIVKRYRDVKIGSYPVIDNEEYSVMVTMESLDDVSLSTALKSLLDMITADKLVRVE